MIGVDIGGANIKLSTADGESLTIPFPMWTDFNRLDIALNECLQQFTISHPRESGILAVTMTGELADCFETRRQGVTHILEHVERACAGWQVHVYSVDGEFLDPSTARQRPWRVAASNWHALGMWLAKAALAPAWPVDSAGGEQRLLVDVGSTTVDIIPLNEHGVATPATNDRQRLQLGQLVYTGMQRTPVAAILQAVVLDGGPCPLMAERFATSDDAYLVLGLVPEVPADLDTADGRPRTTACARARLARMVGEDMESLDVAEVERIADQVIDSQADHISAAIERNLPGGSESRLTRLLISGHGRPLMERVIARVQPSHCFWLDEVADAACSRSAPARAVAWLLERQLSDRNAV